MRKITFILLLLCASLTTGQESYYTIKNIDQNTKLSDFGVSYFGETEAVFASSRTKRANRSLLWTNKQPFLQLYKGTLSDDGEIDSLQSFSQKINTKYHESNVTFTKDLKTVYFSRNNYYKGKYTKDANGTNLIQMYKANIGENGVWTDIVPMPFNNREYQTGHPVLNNDETKLYFTSDMPGSLGETDIFVVDINSDGTYGTPQNLGYNVNTVGKEMFPFIDNNDLLYFSSDGYLEGKGGLDIYVADLNDKLPPKNLGLPINSNKDDFSFVYRSGMKKGHFSSNRDGGKGDDDIYSFVDNRVAPLVAKECNQIANGVVRVKGTNELLPGAKVDLYDGKGRLLESVYADSYARFTFKVDCKSFYKVVGSKRGYQPDNTSFTSTEEADLELDLGLNLASLNEFITQRDLVMININMIYFDLDKSFIRPDAAIELDKVIRVMKKYPLIKIELGSHTDSRSSDRYNRDLSNRRATSTKSWLVNRGISTYRITERGYGETQLVNHCSDGVKCSEAEHQMNRRTEFVILNPEVIK
jgi:outer membrane protein OmpA-like peptidoglycan-associated protein